MKGTLSVVFAFVIFLAGVVVGKQFLTTTPAGPSPGTTLISRSESRAPGDGPRQIPVIPYKELDNAGSTKRSNARGHTYFAMNQTIDPEAYRFLMGSSLPRSEIDNILDSMNSEEVQTSFNGGPEVTQEQLRQEFETSLLANGASREEVAIASCAAFDHPSSPTELGVYVPPTR
ncbi:MAG: hypothetical protein A4E58_02446 [Syntrophorhabdus sp. PtaB.Bin006]|nr:MAG: hypothetical protein A4E58_02446 [Syntrophorhabdus sp. PtaB.Bin006]